MLFCCITLTDLISQTYYRQSALWLHHICLEFLTVIVYENEWHLTCFHLKPETFQIWQLKLNSIEHSYHPLTFEMFWVLSTQKILIDSRKSSKKNSCWKKSEKNLGFLKICWPIGSAVYIAKIHPATFDIIALFC